MLARVALLLTGLVAACGFTGRAHGDDAGRMDAAAGVDVPTTPWLAGFTSRRPVDLGEGVLAERDFPLAIRAPGDASLATTDPQAPVAVTADDGTTVLPLEIEQYDHATGALAVWVRVPALAPHTRLWLYAGGSSGAVATGDATPVWDPARYQAVWHMSDGELGTVRDSTGAGEDLVANTVSAAPAGADGTVGRARQFDGNDDVIEHDDVANGNLDFPVRTRRLRSRCGSTRILRRARTMSRSIKGNASVGERGYDIELGANGWFAYVSDTVHDHAPTFGAADTFFGRWVALAIVIDRGGARAAPRIADAQLVANEDISDLASISGAYYFQLGLAGYTYAGLLDEVRLAGVAEPVDWLADERANLADPTFVVVGASRSGEIAPASGFRASGLQARIGLQASLQDRSEDPGLRSG